MFKKDRSAIAGTFILNAAEKLRCPSPEVAGSRARTHHTHTYIYIYTRAHDIGTVQYILVTVFSIRDTEDYRALHSRCRCTGIREKFVENFIGVATAPFVSTSVAAAAVAAAVPG